ncbi:hypothetical protein EDB19DRAFT_1914961 [Suillus lakei]|nr:hypothetical protein EDB19DRAFT_1914961 [Suillus lakei]
MAEMVENEPMNKGKSTDTMGKNISNMHPVLKTIIHPIFFQLCGVEASLNKAMRVEELLMIEPLENGEPCAHNAVTYTRMRRTAKGDNVPIEMDQPTWAHGNNCTMIDEWAEGGVYLM